MMFRMRHWPFFGAAPTEDIGGVVESAIAAAEQGSEGGMLEQLEQVNKAQTKVLMLLAQQLGVEQQSIVARQLGADPVEEQQP